MKIWLKYLIGIGLGIISAFVIPIDSPNAQSVLNFISDLVVRFGRYIIIPLLFFSVTTSIYKLREENQLLKTGIWTFSTIIISSLLLTFLGILSALIIKLPRIPITVEKINEASQFNWQDLLTKLFPYSALETLLDGSYLLPCFIFAGLVGGAAASDKNASKASFTLFESLSKVFYTVLAFIIDILCVGMVAIMARWTINLRHIFELKVYNYLILVLFVDFVLITFVIYPIILRTVCHDHHPFKVIYASIAPLMVAFFSGDTNFTLGLNMHHGKENLGIRRRVNSVSFPLFAIFGRGGAALVQSICFVLIMRSYSYLGITVLDVLWIAGISFILSFALAEIPSGGPFFAITIMCSLYGRGFETGYLLLRNVAPIICAFAAAIDCITAIVGSYIVAVKNKMLEPVQTIKKFV